MGVGVLAGLGLTLAAVGDASSGETNTGLLIAGTAAMGGGIAIGLGLLYVPDSAEVEVRRADLEPARHDALRVAGETGGAHGLGLTGAF